MTQKNLTLVTIVTRDYYWWAKTWADSAKASFPEAEIVIAFAESPTEEIKQWLNEFQLINVSEIAESCGIDNFRRMAFQYTPFELTCALKPFVVRYLHQSSEKVIYLDADTLIYRRLEEVERELEQSEIVVTPHLLTPESVDRECRIRAAGTINGGFLATRAGTCSKPFLDWWAERCRFDCFIDPFSGHFVDQCWLDLANSFFGSFKILREETLNVAYWNINQRQIVEADRSFQVNGQPLGFFHFSGFDLGKPSSLSQFDNQKLSDALLKLTAEYRTTLKQNQRDDLQAIECQYNCYQNGVPIEPWHREAVRGRWASFEGIQDPFDVENNPDFLNQLNEYRSKLILTRKQWQLEELQREADRQTEWIRKKVNRRLDRRLFQSIRNFCSFVSEKVFTSGKDPTEGKKAA